MFSDCEVAIIGAGPYGLAAAAHLRAAGVEARIFGRPMEFWRERMPTGMLLRSSWSASHISDPYGRFTLEAFEKAGGVRLPRPIPLGQFVDYGVWFQRQAVPAAACRPDPSPAPRAQRGWARPIEPAPRSRASPGRRRWESRDS